MNQVAKISIAGFSLLFLLIAASCGQSGELAAMIEEVANYEHCLVPYDSIGVRVGDVRLLFGFIYWADLTVDGNIAILDNTYEGVRFYSPDGTHIETFAPIGEGPGELLALDRMAFDQEGNLYLGDYSNRKMCLYDRDFNLLKEIEFFGGFRSGAYRMFPGPDSTFILKTGYFTEDSFGTEVARYSTEETPDHIYRRRMVSAAEGMNFQQLTAMVLAVDPAGRVYIADAVHDEFKIICYSQDGDSLFSFGFDDYEPIAVPQHSRDSYRERELERYIDFSGSAEGFNFESPEYYRAIMSIAIDSQNRIWVREEYNTRISYIFNDEGTYLFTMGTDLPGWQTTIGWNLRVSPRGILANPRNPEEFSLVYMMREKTASSSE